MKPLDKDKTLVLRVCREGGYSYDGFQWPLVVGAKVSAPDWEDTEACGNGLHGWAEGKGGINASSYHSAPEAVWLVLEVSTKSIIHLDGKCKFPKAKVVFVGAIAAAAEYMSQYVSGPIIGQVVNEDEPHGTAVAGPLGLAIASTDYASAHAGFHGMAVAGHLGVATSGDCGVSNAKDTGISISGDGGTAAVGHGGIAVVRSDGIAVAENNGVAVVRSDGECRVGDEGIAVGESYSRAFGENQSVAITGFGGKSTTKKHSTSVTGYKGQSTAGDHSTAISGSYGKSVAGDYGTAITGHSGSASAGVGGVIIIHRDFPNPQPPVVGHIGQGDLKPNVLYQLGKKDKFEPAG